MAAKDVMRFGDGWRSHVIDRIPGGDGVSTCGPRTHDRIRLTDGPVMDPLIEWPAHRGQFLCRAGAAMRAQVCVNPGTNPVKVEAGRAPIGLA